MAASLTFYRAAGSETQPEYFGATVSDETVVHFQVQSGPDGVSTWDAWTRTKLNREQFWALENTQPPFAPPYPIEQQAFLLLLKTFILPPLPL